MIEMLKMMNGVDKINVKEFFFSSRMDSDRTRGHIFRVKKRRVRTFVRKGLMH